MTLDEALDEGDGTAHQRIGRTGTTLAITRTYTRADEDSGQVEETKWTLAVNEHDPDTYTDSDGLRDGSDELRDHLTEWEAQEDAWEPGE